MIFNGKRPQLDANTFIAEGAKLIGDISMAEFSSAWFNSVLRADINSITIGAYTNIQDNAVIHVADDSPAQIGNFVTIGHCCTIHGAAIGNNCLIGMGAVIMNNAVVGEGSIVAAGAVVTEGLVIPPHSLVVGLPAKVIRSIPEREAEIHAQAVKYKSLWTEGYGLQPTATGEHYHGERII